MTQSLTDIVLRGYERGDLDALYQLDTICFAEPFRFAKAAMRRYAEARNAQVLLATSMGEKGEDLAGFSIVHAERDGAERLGYLLTLDVAPAFRRRGLAARLLREAEQKAYGSGCAAMLLHVFTENGGAMALYEHAGYVRVGQDTNFYGAGRHAWVYRKPLL